MKTVSLELAKQLKEAGYPQDSLGEFWWFYDLNLNCHLVDRSAVDVGYIKEGRAIASPTADEILDQLSGIKILTSEEHGYIITWIEKVSIENPTSRYKKVFDKSLSDGLAEMWLYLKKEGLLSDE